MFTFKIIEICYVQVAIDIKWICDIYKMGIIDKNKNDSLHNILINLIYDKEIFIIIKNTINKYIFPKSF